MSEPAKKRAKVEYERNRALFSLVGNRVFFCPRVRVMPGEVRLVVGAKYDITADLQPYLLEKYRSAK